MTVASRVQEVSTGNHWLVLKRPVKSFKKAKKTGQAKKTGHS
jgi:hypothetical protein